MNNYAALQNLSIYYTWKNIRQQYKNNKLKIKPQSLNDEFELPDGYFSVSDIQDYMEYIIKKTWSINNKSLLFMLTSIDLIID